MSLQDNKRQWDDLGRLDPLWAMTGTHRFGAWDLEAFLQTGDSQVAQVMQEAERLGRPLCREAVLDFGCGVGRLARAFRAHFERYVGLDISESVITKARAIHGGLSNATFAVSASDTLNLASDSFDLVYSWAVLQHVAERKRAQRYIAEFTRVLRKDGLLIFSAMHTIQPLYRLQPRRRVYALLRAIGVPETVLYHRLKLYPQGVYFIPQTVVVAQLQTLGARVLEIRQDAPPTAPHQVRVYYVTR